MQICNFIYICTMMQKIRHTKVIVGLLMIPFFVLFLHNRFANGHYHYTPDGDVVYHSHPFQKSVDTSSDTPFANHHHSTVDFSMIAMITGGDLFAGLVFVFAAFILNRFPQRCIRVADICVSRFKIRYSDSRAPPSLLMAK